MIKAQSEPLESPTPKTHSLQYELFRNNRSVLVFQLYFDLIGRYFVLVSIFCFNGRDFKFDGSSLLLYTFLILISIILYFPGSQIILAAKTQPDNFQELKSGLTTRIQFCFSYLNLALSEWYEGVSLIFHFFHLSGNTFL